MFFKLKLIIAVFAVFLFTGCVQKAKISMKMPGELNLKGIHKIAVVNFSTIETNKELGLYKADDTLLELAKDEVVNVFYNEPFYSFSDLEIEKIIKEKDFKANVNDRFDGLLYGKVWWQKTPEYRNIIPSKYNLESYKIMRYLCGRTDDGDPIYCDAHITTQTQDKAYDKHYRASKGTLMMSLTLYKISADGMITKATEVFEVANGVAKIVNGSFSENFVLIADKKKLDKVAVLKQKKGGFFDNLLKNGFMSKSNEKVDSDMKITSSMNTIPADLHLNYKLVQEISKKLQRMISPTTEEFAINVEKGDKKVEKLFDYSSFKAITSYISKSILAQNNPKFYDSFNDLEYYETAKKLIAYNHKKEFEEANKNKKKEEEIAIYEPLEDGELEELSKNYILKNAPMIYNYALANEAMGNYEKSLEVYRFLFNNIDNVNQDYADGIGRALLALDMNDKVNEETLNKIKAHRKNKI